MSEKTQWLGEFLLKDREEINSLRAKQVFSIEHGNANSYRDLCTDDILLLLQGMESGWRQLVEALGKLLEPDN